MNELTWSYFNNHYPNIINISKVDKIENREIVAFTYLTNLLCTSMSLYKDENSNVFKEEYKRLYLELIVKDIKIKNKTKKLFKYYSNQIFEDNIPFVDMFLRNNKELNDIPKLCNLYTSMLYNIDKEIDQIIEKECINLLNEYQNDKIGVYCKNNDCFEFDFISNIDPNSEDAYIYKDELDILSIYSENRDTKIKLGKYILENQELFVNFLDFNLMPLNTENINVSTIIDMIHHYDKKDIELLRLNYYDSFCDTDFALKKQDFKSLSKLIKEVEDVLHNNIELNIKADYVYKIILKNEVISKIC